jgi:pimeloyl-ACP methyl ester carboxylesterase
MTKATFQHVLNEAGSLPCKTALAGKLISRGAIFICVLLFCFYNNIAHAQTKKPVIITHAYADVNGVKLHYAKAGNGKRLIMFVHGFPEFWYEYKNQLNEFGGDEYTAVAPDMRGFNLSSKPDAVDDYQVKYMVEDLRQLAEKLGYKKFTLVAHDWGGYIAWWFAIVHAEYLDKLVIINAPHPAIFNRELTDNPAQQHASAYMTFFRSPGAEKTLSANNYKLFVNTVFADSSSTAWFTAADKQAYLNAWSQPGALTGGLNYYRAGFGLGYGITPASYQVNVPTLVIWGEKDKYLMVSNLTGLDQYVPYLTIKRIPDGSHWVIHENPTLVNSYIKAFIR